MLQEILLSLSGVPSPIWERLKDGQNNGASLNHYVSQPEQAMLAILARISQLHIEVKDHTANISAKHPSLVCRAVSSSIAHKHLAIFRKRVIEVESSILKEDATHVGGYQIVPLSTLVVDFAPWSRWLEWLSKLTHFMRGNRSKKPNLGCTAAALMEYLENERHTGYTDLGDIATQLLVVAQSTWMRSVSAWILYGQLPLPGNEDFMVKESSKEDVWVQCTLESALVPSFVSDRAAESILAIGNALRQIQSPSHSVQSGLLRSATHAILALHLSTIKHLQLPLNSVLLESAMLNINHSISRHALSHLLPRNKVIETFRVLQDYMLLGRGEFAVALIENSDARIAMRQQTQNGTRAVKKLGRIDDMVLKEAELDAILSKTWADLAVQQGQNDAEDETFDAARRHLRLRIAHHTEEDKGQPCLTTLLPTPALLHIEVEASSPLKILLPSSIADEYARIDAYLLSIRRSQLRLSNLWKMTSHRRCHPPPLGPPLSATDFGQRACKQRRKREDVRASRMRRFWSSLNKSLFVLNEFNYYLHSEVIENSWKHFEAWLGTNRDDWLHSSSAHQSISTLQDGSNVNSAAALSDQTHIAQSKEDPRTLAHAHTLYLGGLASALLSDDSQFVSTLRAFLRLIDHFIALFSRLSTVWEGLDLQEDDGVMDAFTNHAQDEEEILGEMNRARTNLEDLLLQLVKCIRHVEKAQDVNDISGAISSVGVSHSSGGEFIPWRARTLDRLIMKVDFLYGKEETTENIVGELDYD